MVAITKKRWEILSLTDYRHSFFIEIWRALLNRDTPHFFQARLMNPINSIKEVITLIDDCLEDERYRKQLIISCQELISLINDTTFIKILAVNHNLLNLRLLPLTKDGNVSRNQLLELSQLLNMIIINYENKYIDELLDELLYMLTVDINLYKEKYIKDNDISEDKYNKPDYLKKHILDDIYRITNTLISILLSLGYSPTYLYNRSKKFLNYKSCKTDGFITTLSRLVVRLKKPKIQYLTIQGFNYTDDIFNYIDSILDIKIINKDSEDIPAGISQEPNIEFKIKVDAYFISEIYAYDHTAAGLLMAQKVNSIIDICAFKEKKITLNVSPIVIAIVNDGANRHKTKINVNFLNQEFINRHDLYDSDLITMFSSLLDSVSNQPICNNIQNILRYYRHGILETNYESKILSMWIAFESLSNSCEGNTATRVTHNIPDIYAFDSLSKKISYFSDLLTRHKIDISNFIKIIEENGNPCPDELTNDNDKHRYYCFCMLNDNDLAVKLFKQLENNEYLKYNLVSLHDEFKDTNSILDRFNKTSIDVERQILRIYYLRNKIVHHAYTEVINPKIFTHLCDYIGVVFTDVLMHILYKFTTIEDFKTIFTGYSLAIERRRLELKMKDSIHFEDVYYLDSIL